MSILGKQRNAVNAKLYHKCSCKMHILYRFSLFYTATTFSRKISYDVTQARQLPAPACSTQPPEQLQTKTQQHSGERGEMEGGMYFQFQLDRWLIDSNKLQKTHPVLRGSTNYKLAKESNRVIHQLYKQTHAWSVLCQWPGKKKKKVWDPGKKHFFPIHRRLDGS